MLQGKKMVWLKLPVDQAEFIPLAVKVQIWSSESQSQLVLQCFPSSYMCNGDSEPIESTFFLFKLNNIKFRVFLSETLSAGRFQVPPRGGSLPDDDVLDPR